MFPTPVQRIVINQFPSGTGSGSGLAPHPSGTPAPYTLQASQQHEPLPPVPRLYGMATASLGASAGSIRAMIEHAAMHCDNAQMWAMMKAVHDDTTISWKTFATAASRYRKAATVHREALAARGLRFKPQQIERQYRDACPPPKRERTMLGSLLRYQDPDISIDSFVRLATRKYPQLTEGSVRSWFMYVAPLAESAAPVGLLEASRGRRGQKADIDSDEDLPTMKGFYGPRFQPLVNGTPDDAMSDSDMEVSEEVTGVMVNLMPPSLFPKSTPVSAPPPLATRRGTRMPHPLPLPTPAAEEVSTASSIDS